MYSAANHTLLVKNKITHILIASKKIMPPYLTDFTYQILPIEDVSETDLIPLFAISNEFINNGRKAGNVLVHCMAGMSRSASVVIGYLISTGMTYEAAYLHVKMHHPQTCPNEGFREQLQKYAKTLEKSATTS